MSAPQHRDALLELADAILERDTAGTRLEGRLMARARIADALEAILGPPPTDHVAGVPLTVWGRLRDLTIRLERLERAVNGTDAPGGRAAPQEARSSGLPPVTDDLVFDVADEARVGANHVRAILDAERRLLEAPVRVPDAGARSFTIGERVRVTATDGTGTIITDLGGGSFLVELDAAGARSFKADELALIFEP